MEPGSCQGSSEAPGGKGWSLVLSDPELVKSVINVAEWVKKKEPPQPHVEEVWVPECCWGLLLSSHPMFVEFFTLQQIP